MSFSRGSVYSYVPEKIRNSVGRSQLAKRIEELDKEERSDLKMMETSKSQFRLKFLKYEPVPPSSGSEAKNVRMYETHTPGFCYRRNGDIRFSQFSPTNVKSHCFQDVRDLLFSNNEVDIEKVLCLHLLAAHNFIKQRHSVRSCNSPHFYSRPAITSSSGLDLVISNPKKSSLRAANTPTRSFLSSPIQKVKRDILAKKTNTEPSAEDTQTHAGLSKLLPSYVIDITRKAMVFDDVIEGQVNEDDYWDSISNEEIEINKQNLDLKGAYEFGIDTEHPDESLSLKVLTKNEIIKQDNNVPLYMNKQIEQLVDSVIEILQEVNPGKVQQMIHIARQPSALKKLIAKPEIQSFIEKLSGKPLMSSWDSFRVSPAKVVTIREKSTTMGELPTDMAELGKEEEELMVVNLEIANTTISLEKLVSEIRKNVLQEAARSYQELNPQSQVEEEDSDSLHEGSWRNLYRISSNSALKTNVIRSTTMGSRALLQKKSEINKNSSFKSINTINVSTTEKTNKTGRVSKSPDISSSKKQPAGSGFTLVSYTGFRHSKRLTSSGMLSLESTASKDTNEQDKTKNAKRKKAEGQATKRRKRSQSPKNPKNDENERLERRGPPKLRTDDPFSMRKVKCPVCKERPIVIPEYENTTKFVNRRCTPILPTSSINVIDEIEKPFKEFKDQFLNDDFFKTRGLEDLLKTASTPAKTSLRESELSRSRPGSDNYSSKLASITWDMIRLNQTVPSVPLTNQREQVEQLLLQRMTPNERMLVFRKLSSIKSDLMCTDDTSSLDSIPFASYVAPVLSKKSVMRLLEGIEGRVKDVICLPANKGGLGMGAYFGGSNNDISNLKSHKSSTKMLTNEDTENKVNSQLTVLELEKLKVEIARKETHKKYLEFLKKKIP